MDLQALRIQMGQNLAEIEQEVQRACLVSGRSVDEVQILAISKKQPIEVLQVAYGLGIKNFGESYVQEALEKMESLEVLPDIVWEMVGHVQSRKAKQVASFFNRIHSLDSLKLAGLLSRNRPKDLKPLEAYLEVNLAAEESKGGFHADSASDWEALLPVIENIQHLEGIKLVGLMAMPPLFEDAQLSRPYFARLRNLRDYLNENLKGLNLTGLSAGTSSDFGVAIEEGATVIRIGERLLGPRNYQN